MPDPIRIQTDDDGALDQIDCRSAFVVLERMDSGAWFLSINNGEQTARIDLFTIKKARILAMVQLEAN